MQNTARKLITFLGVALFLGGCMGGGKLPDGLGGKEDRWNWRNDPSRFDGDLNYHLSDLPETGTAEREAWPSTYWPTYEDSINHRWNGDDLSPAEKYDMAFNDWTPSEEFESLRPFNRYSPVPEEDWDPGYYDQLGPLARHVSQNMGNRRDRDLAVEHGGRPPEEEVEEWPVETWWGLCHAWVPAAILEDRPLRAVEHNGVTFEVGDIEALMIAAYNRSSASMIGDRCNAGADDDNVVERDETGRAVNVECRDSNPGAFHVIVTNYLGMMNRGFAMDRTYDYQVWNQPVAGFEITRQEEITVEDAHELLEATGDTYAYNEDAVTLYRVHTSLHWITESHASTVPNETARYTRTDRLTYILEVDADGKIIGGEWFGNSRDTHPDFLWNPRRLIRSSVPHLSLHDVRMLVEMSREPVNPVEGETLVASGPGSLPIPDNDAAGVTSAATVTGEGVVVTAEVAVDITHTYIGDLEITLAHGGVTRTLHNREGGGTDDLRRSFDVVGFEGADPNGEWTLSVADRAGRDVGTLESWTLTLGVEDGEPEEPPAPEATRYPGEGGVAIPDLDPEGVSSVAQVDEEAEGQVAIAVSIRHTWIGDLRVEVEHDGRRWTLHDREGNGADDLAIEVPLDATGNAFEGDPSGTWTLHVSDHAGQDVGTLESWAVVVR